MLAAVLAQADVKWWAASFSNFSQTTPPKKNDTSNPKKVQFRTQDISKKSFKPMSSHHSNGFPEFSSWNSRLSCHGKLSPLLLLWSLWKTSPPERNSYLGRKKTAQPGQRITVRKIRTTRKAKNDDPKKWCIKSTSKLSKPLENHDISWPMRGMTYPIFRRILGLDWGPWHEVTVQAVLTPPGLTCQMLATPFTKETGLAVTGWKTTHTYLYYILYT